MVPDYQIPRNQWNRVKVDTGTKHVFWYYSYDDTGCGGVPDLVVNTDGTLYDKSCPARDWEDLIKLDPPNGWAPPEPYNFDYNPGSGTFTWQHDWEANLGSDISYELTRVCSSVPEYTLDGLSQSGVFESGDWVVRAVVDGVTSEDVGPFTVVGECESAINSFSPSSGSPSTFVEIYGNRFNCLTSVEFNGTEADIVYFTNTQIDVKVPQGASSGKITVITSECSAQSDDDFNIITQVAVTSFSPTSGPVGAEVTISGLGFSSGFGSESGFINSA